MVPALRDEGLKFLNAASGLGKGGGFPKRIPEQINSLRSNERRTKYKAIAGRLEVGEA